MIRPVTVIELGPFRRHVGEILSEDEREAFIDHIARHPNAGPVIQGTGGARKIRWAKDGAGKRGGVRVIYYYHGPTAPIFLLTLYPKSQKANLTAQEKMAIKTSLEVLKQQIRLTQATERAPVELLEP